MPLNYDAISALTRKKYVPELVDQFFNSHALLAKLRARQKPWDGGTQIVQPISYGELSGGKSFSGFDTVTPDQTTPISAAAFDPKFLVVPVTYAFTDQLINRGENAVLDHVEAKMDIARQTLEKMFATQLYGDGTGNSGKDITGLAAAVAATGVYGGIDRATYTWWQAKVYANGGTPRPLTTALMRKAIIEASDGPAKPDLIITTDKSWNRYAEIAENKLVLSGGGKMLADLGFSVLEFMQVPVVPDKDCPPGTMYMLNTKRLYLRYHPDCNFYATKIRQASNQVAFLQEILWAGNLTCSECRRQAVIEDLDETGY